jgi:type II secretory pathway component PulF
MAQFAVVLSGLIKSGVPIMQSLSAAGRTAGNVYINQVIEEIVDDVREGSGLAGPIRRHSIFPPLVSQMVAAGEASGALDEMLLKVAVYFDELADRKIKNLSSLIEPIMMACLAGIVLFLAMAIFLPMWDMTKMAGR